MARPTRKKPAAARVATAAFTTLAAPAGCPSAATANEISKTVLIAARVAASAATITFTARLRHPDPNQTLPSAPRPLSLAPSYYNLRGEPQGPDALLRPSSDRRMLRETEKKPVTDLTNGQ